MRKLLLCLGLIPMLGQALPLEAARDELAAEYAFCASYYSVGSVLSENSGHKEEADRMRTTIDRALNLSAGLSNPKTAQARYELAMQAHLKTFKEEGFARLMMQHMEPCKAALEQPETRFQYWLSKK